MRTAAWAFLVVAGLVAIARGPGRALHEGDDLAPAYAASRAWLLGQNPYDGATLTRVLFDAGRGTDAGGRRTEGPAIYAPTLFVALAPIAALPWGAARIAFLLVALALFAWHLPALLRLAQLSWRDTAGVWLAGGILALAPYHTGIALGQPAIPCVALVVLALDRERAGGGTLAGVFLGVALLLKPQIAAPFLLYFFLRHRPRPAWVSLAVLAGAALAGVAVLSAHGVPWLSDWRAALDATRSGVEHDPAGPFSAQLVDLRPLVALTGMGGTDAVAAIVALALAALAYLWGRTLDASRDLLLAGTVGVLTLLGFYHRFYDAALLSLPLAWSASSWKSDATGTSSGRDTLAVVATVCCAVFFLPGAWMLQRLAIAGTVSGTSARSFGWNVLLLRQQNWALVVLACTLLVAVRRARDRRMRGS